MTLTIMLVKTISKILLRALNEIIKMKTLRKLQSKKICIIIFPRNISKVFTRHLEPSMNTWWTLNFGSLSTNFFRIPKTAFWLFECLLILNHFKEPAYVRGIDKHLLFLLFKHFDWSQNKTVGWNYFLLKELINSFI